jgi:hypothetical protein
VIRRPGTQMHFMTRRVYHALDLDLYVFHGRNMHLLASKAAREPRGILYIGDAQYSNTSSRVYHPSLQYLATVQTVTLARDRVFMEAVKQEQQPQTLRSPFDKLKNASGGHKYMSRHCRATVTL